MLIHFTRTIKSLDSITRNGFLYLHNETEILRPALLDAFGVKSGDDQSNGMVCFTEIAPEQTYEHQEMFGKYGIGVSKQWLLYHKVRKVEYVEVYGDEYYKYVDQLKAHVPPVIMGRKIEDLLKDLTANFELTRVLSDRVRCGKFCKENSSYLRVLERLEWTQTDKHIAEAEWRIRNPKPYRFIGNSTRKQQVDTLVSCISDPKVLDVFDGLVKYYAADGSTELVCVGKLSLVLRCPKEVVKAFFCPKEDLNTIKCALLTSGIGHVPVYVSDGTDVLLA